MAKTVYNLLRKEQGEAGEYLDQLATRSPGLAAKDQLKTGAAPDATRIPIITIPDIVTARQHGRELANRYGFSETKITLMAAVISELSRNMILYAQGGTISLGMTNGGSRAGTVIRAEDDGPGIPNLDRVMMGGYSTSGGLGLGLCGVQRIADEFRIDTNAGTGTKITVTQWLA
ncbi:MAG: ATP-binding protein [Gammaproteobacteria bacterium]|nr:ATP-binding protein [Gammaproteobacteria bacterium]